MKFSLFALLFAATTALAAPQAGGARANGLGLPQERDIPADAAILPTGKPTATGKGKGPKPTATGKGKGKKTSGVPRPTGTGFPVFPGDEIQARQDASDVPLPTATGKGKGPKPTGTGKGKGPKPTATGKGKGKKTSGVPRPTGTGFPIFPGEEIQARQDASDVPLPTATGKGKGPKPTGTGKGKGPKPTATGKGKGKKTGAPRPTSSAGDDDEDDQ